MLRPSRFLQVLALVIASAACAPQGDDANQAPAGNEGVAEDDIRTPLSDAQLQGKLKGILKDVSFTSESDYPYVVLEGETVTEKRLTTKLVREKLKNAVKAASSAQRDISLPACRAVRLDVGQAIAEGDAAQVPANREDDDFVYAYHDKQVGIALKTMRAQLKSVVGFTFGTNDSGDQDDVGTVHYVYVGISKTTGKLIAIMTEAVYT
jgi:hypothetical protein